MDKTNASADCDYRLATPTDYDGIFALHHAAFPESENQLVAGLAVELLELDSNLHTVNFVAHTANKIIGHVAFSPLSMAQIPDANAYLLAPLAVMPGFQHQGIGSRLVKMGIDWLIQHDQQLLFVYGDPAYYQRFGFDDKNIAPYHPPYPLQYPFGWLMMALQDQQVAQVDTDISCVKPLCNPQLW